MADSTEPSKEDKAETRKAKNRARAKLYYQKNKHRILKKNKAWVQSNKERHRAACKAWRNLNKDREQEKQRQWRAKNPEKAAAAQKRYREKNCDALLEKRIANRDRAREYSRKHYENNKESYRIRRQQYRLNNAEKLSAIGKAYYKKNKEKVLDSHKKYRQNNQESNRLRNRLYQQQKWRGDFSYWLKKTVARRMRDAIAGQSAKKQSRTSALIGCSSVELIAHIESRFLPGMSWDNYGYRGWHIDHIIPLAKFDLRDEEQQKAAFHYTNLQPLWATENLKKGNRIAGQHLFGFAYAAKIADGVSSKKKLGRSGDATRQYSDD